MINAGSSFGSKVINLNDLISDKSQLHLWVEPRDKYLMGIFKEELQRLNLENEDISLYIPDEINNCNEPTSVVCSGRLNEKEWYHKIKLIPRDYSSYTEARKAIRHELSHIANGNHKRFVRFPLFFRRILHKLSYQFIDEGRARKYETGIIDLNDFSKDFDQNDLIIT